MDEGMREGVLTGITICDATLWFIGLRLRLMGAYDIYRGTLGQYPFLQDTFWSSCGQFNN